MCITFLFLNFELVRMYIKITKTFSRKRKRHKNKTNIHKIQKQNIKDRKHLKLQKCYSILDNHTCACLLRYMLLLESEQYCLKSVTTHLPFRLIQVNISKVKKTTTTKKLMLFHVENLRLHKNTYDNLLHLSHLDIHAFYCTLPVHLYTGHFCI